VYVDQLQSFQLTNKKYYVWRLRKALYGLKHVPGSWYYRLDRYLHQQRFKKRIVDRKLYIKDECNDLLIIVVYVDDIIFGNNIE
jgi:hypothetical protein